MNNPETEPEAYALGFIPFIHTDIYLDSRPLIPRTETEYWVDLAIKEMGVSGVKNPKILDLCAGSGCIGVAVLKELPEARVDFAEIDEKHHFSIQKNIERNMIETGRARIFGGDLFENIQDSYDFILSNPPYINPELKNRIQESVILHEPELALYGGKEGLEVINKILYQVKSYINPGGVLYLEHEPEQTEFLLKHSGYLNSSSDQFGLIRFSRFSPNKEFDFL